MAEMERPKTDDVGSMPSEEELPRSAGARQSEAAPEAEAASADSGARAPEPQTDKQRLPEGDEEPWVSPHGGDLEAGPGDAPAGEEPDFQLETGLDDLEDPAANENKDPEAEPLPSTGLGTPNLSASGAEPGDGRSGLMEEVMEWAHASGAKGFEILNEASMLLSAGEHPLEDGIPVIARLGARELERAAGGRLPGSLRRSLVRVLNHAAMELAGKFGVAALRAFPRLVQGIGRTSASLGTHQGDLPRVALRLATQALRPERVERMLRSVRAARASDEEASCRRRRSAEPSFRKPVPRSFWSPGPVTITIREACPRCGRRASWAFAHGVGGNRTPGSPLP